MKLDKCNEYVCDDCGVKMTANQRLCDDCYKTETEEEETNGDGEM
jgi:uncharacterized OB-fold protein